MDEDRRPFKIRLLDRIDGKLQKLFIHLVDRSGKSDAELQRLQLWEERLQAESKVQRKKILRRKCKKIGHEWFGNPSVEMRCERCGDIDPMTPEGCLYVTEDEHLGKSDDSDT
jgi:hypothetical protein